MIEPLERKLGKTCDQQRFSSSRELGATPVWDDYSCFFDSAINERVWPADQLRKLLVDLVQIEFNTLTHPCLQTLS
jgi:hypothetical protein